MFKEAIMPTPTQETQETQETRKQQEQERQAEEIAQDIRARILRCVDGINNNGWNKNKAIEILKKDVAPLLKNTIDGGIVFEKLEAIEGIRESKEMMKYVEILKMGTILQILDNGIARDLKTHYKYKGEDILKAVIARGGYKDIRTIELADWQGIKGYYYLNNNDIIAFMVKQFPRAKYEDHKAIYDNAGITEENYRAYLEAQKDKPSSTKEKPVTIEQGKEEERLAELQKLIVDGQEKLKELSDRLIKATKNDLENIMQDAKSQGIELKRYYTENQEYSSIANQRELVLSIYNQLVEIHTEAKKKIQSSI